jgi:hypothetical protein
MGRGRRIVPWFTGLAREERRGRVGWLQMAASGRARPLFQEGSIQVEEICATTGIGYLRPAPTTTVYTYPGDGAATLTPPADR